MTAVEVLMAARAKVKRGWCQGRYVMGNGDGEPAAYCAAGAISRSGLVRRAYGFSEWELMDRWERAAILDERGILTQGTSEMRFDRGALVFPLLWAADELEAQDG